MMGFTFYDILKEEGEKEMLLKMIEGKFGIIPSYLQNIIMSESSEKIYLFAQALFDLQSMDEIEEWWRKQGADDVRQ